MKIVLLCLACVVLVFGIGEQAAYSESPLPENILVADRGNNRIIEITPDKRIVWEYDFKGLKPGYGADDAFFTPDNTKIVANVEQEHEIVVIDYATRQIVWQYGTSGEPGSTHNHLYEPDDAYPLADGNVMVADIKNCRVIIIAPDKHIVKQYGKTRRCISEPGYFDKPNGDTPLPNGNLLVSEVLGRMITEVNASGKIIFRFKAPLSYPSDPQPTPRGTIIVCDYNQYGRILELDKKGHLLWEYSGYDPQSAQALNHPSLAAELPNGNIIANDDFNHRIIVIDKATKDIIWQYGVDGQPGDAPGYLNIPDGLDWRGNVANLEGLVEVQQVEPPSALKFLELLLVR